ncbi:MAG: amino acid adenylation domain-containing protein [Acidobacteriota bacterium]|nr:amino acid adenylation domain-containing protein [Acidobacteriota bacterium]
MSEGTAGFQFSWQQKHLWSIGAEEPAFQAAVAVSLTGNLEIETLKNSLNAVVLRHEILRTTFKRRPGMKVPVQIIQASLAAAWEQLDLRSLSAEQQRVRVDELFQEAQRHPFNLERGPIVRATLLSLAEDSHVLLVAIPSLCADSTTLKNLMGEMSDFYASRIPAAEVFQYADFSAWQSELREQEQDEEVISGRQYWRDLLPGFVSDLRLPFEARHSEVTKFCPETISIEVSPKVQSRAATQPAPFFAACWQILLWRLTGQTGVVVGHLCDGRNHEELVGAMGLFARTLPIPYEFNDTRTFAEVMQDLQTLKTHAYQNQDYLNFEDTPQDFYASFVAEELPARRSAKNFSFSLLRQSSNSERFRMQLRLLTTDETWSLQLDYDPQYFARSAAERVAGCLSNLLEEVVQKPSASVAELEIMGGAERQEVLLEFNRTAGEYPRDKCVHQLFEEQAAKKSEQLALRFGETSLTYAELNARANQLAHSLRRQGVKPNVTVGLCLDRSAEMIVALLGILKAGGAYVPLIPDNPKARLAQQLSEIKAPVLVTEKKYLPNLPAFSGITICLDVNADLLSKEPTTNLEHINSSQDLVYVIFTSGSTGIPKGVAVSHSSLVNYSWFVSQKLHADSEALNFATVSTLAADLGNTSIFPSLISGGCLHVIDYETGMAGSLFCEYLKRHPVDVLKITPSHLNSLLGGGGNNSPLPGKYLVLGGEATSWDLLQRVQEAGTCAVINHYGPTEATVGCCTFSVGESDVSEWTPVTVPIGRPIANAQIYILDSRMRPVPLGVPGELCIGGVGVAIGYLNQPQQTSEHFVTNPFSQDADARLYRTGDLARFLPDGNVEFLGRIDRQVKIRGFRVEPAEIEAVLNKHSAVEQVVVLADEDRPGDKRLIAYVVCKNSTPPSEEFQAFLKERLPDYMVPAAIISLPKLPLTKNGKLDLAALPSPEQVAKGVERVVVLPRNRVEEGLVDIWKHVLQLPQIGVTDNFFDLGGHSLLATQVISRVRSTFRVQLPLRSLFDTPTVAGLATQIAQMPQTSEDEEVAKLLRELEGLSDEEAERLLANDMPKGGNGPTSGNS